MQIEEMKTIVSKVYEEMGIPFDLKSRTRENMLAKVIASNILMDKGVFQRTIGEVVGKHRTTILYYHELFQSWLAFRGYYEKELNLYNKIKKAI